jgi:hypothetical protein
MDTWDAYTELHNSEPNFSLNLIVNMAVSLSGSKALNS